jgi:hypothetical protein
VARPVRVKEKPEPEELSGTRTLSPFAVRRSTLRPRLIRSRPPRRARKLRGPLIVPSKVVRPCPSSTQT